MLPTSEIERGIKMPKRLSEVSGREVLVGIPTRNEADHIEACIRSLMYGDGRLSDVKFVVADGGSTDGTVDIVRSLQSEFSNLHLKHNPKKLQSAALNLVVRDEKNNGHNYLVRCDAHAMYPPRLCNECR